VGGERMSFYHGKSSRVYLNGNPMSSYADNVNVSISADTVETTTFIDTAKKYVMGLKNATLTAEGFGAGSTGEIDQYLQAAINSTGNIWTWYPSEVTGRPGYGMAGYNTQYDIKASISGAVRVSVACQSNVGKEPVMCIRAMAQATISSQGAAIDGTAKSTSGGAGYLQVSAENIADAQAYIEHSSDGSSWETLAAFSTASIGASAQRVAINGEIRRYVRSSVTATTSVTYGTALCRF
jgi:hypothetical protein